MARSAGYYAPTGKQTLDGHIFQAHDPFILIWYKKMNSKCHISASHMILVSKYSHFFMARSAGYYIPTGKEILDGHIFQAHEHIILIWYKKVNSKCHIPASQMILVSKYSHFFMARSAGYYAPTGTQILDRHIFQAYDPIILIWYKQVDSKCHIPASHMVLVSK